MEVNEWVLCSGESGYGADRWVELMDVWMEGGLSGLVCEWMRLTRTQWVIAGGREGRWSSVMDCIRERQEEVDK